jgi:Tfp pilus assembly protein PilN
MRPINLIPTEERRGHGGTARTGPLAYIVVGALGVVLIGVVMLVLTSNTISTREGEVESLQAEKAVAAAKSAELAPYTSFEQVAVQRTAAVSELADSRFDWARVVRQLSLILPRGVFITSLTASAGGSESEGGGLSVASPSLVLSGCASGQDGVAAFVSALKQIDGVTRVGLSNSSLAEGVEPSEGEAGECGGATFNMTVAFDEAPPSVDAAGVAVEPPPETESSGGEEGSEEDESSSEGAAEGETTAEGTAAAATTSEPTG